MCNLSPGFAARLCQKVTQPLKCHFSLASLPRCSVFAFGGASVEGSGSLGNGFNESEVVAAFWLASCDAPAALLCVYCCNTTPEMSSLSTPQQEKCQTAPLLERCSIRNVFSLPLWV